MGGGVKHECIVLFYVCMYYWVCSAYSTTDSKVFPYKTHFIRYILKVLQKTSEVFLFFLLFFFFLNMVTSAAVRASITTNMSNE